MQNVFVRATLLYLACLLAMRLMGKRQIGELAPFELVITILVAQLAASPMSDVGIPLVHGLVPLFAIFVIHQLLSILILHSPAIQAFVCGKPSILVQNGRLRENILRNQLITTDDLIAQLRVLGFVRLSDIESAILETNGRLSVLPTAAARPATPADLQISVAPDSMPVSLIMDGRVYAENLKVVGRDLPWLEKQLKSQKLKSGDVLLALYYPGTEELHIQPKEKIGAAK